MKRFRGLNSNRKKGLGIMAAFIVLMLLIGYYIGRPMTNLISDPDAFRAYMSGLGALGILLFVLMVVIQVFAVVIPAGPLQLTSGALFGVWKGILIYDLSMVLGCSLVFFISRKFGMKFVSLFYPEEKLRTLDFLQTSGKFRLLLFLCILIPGFPKDILTFFVGLTEMRFRDYAPIMAIGRLPSIVLTVTGGSAILYRNAGILTIIVAISLAFYVWGFFFMQKLLAQASKAAKESEECLSPSPDCDTQER